MQQFSCARFCRVLLALVLASVLGMSHAVELGEPLVRSHIGQPLVADIELTMVSDSGGPVVVRLAHPDVFRGANIAVHPILSNLTMSVMRRDGKQFLHITSVRQLDAEYVHLFLNLSQGSKTDVRAATLWLTPDPTPPAPPSPPPAPVVAPVSLPAPVRNREHAAPAAAPAPKQLTAEQMKVCSTLDYKNGLLSAQIVELEEKVKQLQLAMESKSDHAPAAEAAPVIKGPVAIKPAAPPVKKEGEKEAGETAGHAKAGGLPWRWIGIGVTVLVLALGGGIFLLRRRRRNKTAGPAAAGGEETGVPVVTPENKADYMAKLKETLQRKKKQSKPE